MNWKLIVTLSLFGLVMAFATVSLISSTVEPFCWLAIFCICAYLIAKKAPGMFLFHGFLVSMVNSVWITAVHVLFFDTYMAHHPEMAAMSGPFQPSRVMMLVSGPIFGALSGIVLGVFAFVAAKLFRKPAA